MKARFLLVTFFILTVFFQAQAQERKFNFGLKVAPVVPWLSVTEKGASSDGALFRFNWGFVAAGNFSKNFAMISGINVNALGGKIKYDGNSDNQKNKYSEIQLPLIFQMKSDEIGFLKIYAQIGIAEGVIISSKGEDNESLSSTTKRFNTSYIVAGGVDFPVGGGMSIFTEIKYNGGLTYITKKTNHKARTNFIELGIGVLF